MTYESFFHFMTGKTAVLRVLTMEYGSPVTVFIGLG